MAPRRPSYCLAGSCIIPDCLHHHVAFFPWLLCVSVSKTPSAFLYKKCQSLAAAPTQSRLLSSQHDYICKRSYFPVRAHSSWLKERRTYLPIGHNSAQAGREPCLDWLHLERSTAAFLQKMVAFCGWSQGRMPTFPPPSSLPLLAAFLGSLRAKDVIHVVLDLQMTGSTFKGR